MAHRKQLPQPRACAQCGITFHTARKGHVHCSSACNTRAWRHRKPRQVAAAGLTAPTATLPVVAPLAPLPPAPVSVALSKQSVGTIALGTVVGNAITAVLTNLLTGPATPPPPRGQPFPTWPPAELLAAASPPLWVEDPAWSGRRWLTPTTYHGHTLYLYAEAGLPYVLWQVSSGEWRLLTSPAHLLQLAQQRPVMPALRAILRRQGMALEPILVGLPLFNADTPPSAPTTLGWQ